MKELFDKTLVRKYDEPINLSERTYYSRSSRNYNGWQELFGQINIQAARDLAKYQKALKKEMAKANANKMVITKYANKIKAIDEYLSSNFYKAYASVSKEDIYRIAEAIVEGKVTKQMLRQM